MPIDNSSVRVYYNAPLSESAMRKDKRRSLVIVEKVYDTPLGITDFKRLNIIFGVLSAQLLYMHKLVLYYRSCIHKICHSH